MSFEEFHDGRCGAILDIEMELWFPVSLQCPNQVSAQSDFGFGRRYGLKNFNGGHLGHQNRTIVAILNVYVTPMSPIKFQSNTGCEEISLK